MFQQDHILRQVQQLAEVLARALFHKQAEQPDQARDVVSDGLASVLGLDLGALCKLSQADVLALCAPGGVLSGDKAVAVADVLREAPAAAAARRALWLYEAALGSGEAVPFDVHARMRDLRARLP